MKGSTTIAAIPSGAGFLSALPAEVGEAKPKYEITSEFEVTPAYRIRLALAQAIAQRVDREMMALANVPNLPVIDADMLDTSKGN